MKRLIVLCPLLLAACGAPGGGGGGGGGGISNSSHWSLFIIGAELPTQTPAGDAWDSFGGAPDPFVCVRAGTSAEWCTSVADDTFSATWGEVSDTYTHGQLGDVVLTLYDEDISDHDVVFTHEGSLQATSADTPRDAELFGNDATLELTIQPE